jgi:hypothetical protein
MMLQIGFAIFLLFFCIRADGPCTCASQRHLSKSLPSASQTLSAHYSGQSAGLTSECLQPPTPGVPGLLCPWVNYTHRISEGMKIQLRWHA